MKKIILILIFIFTITHGNISYGVDILVPIEKKLCEGTLRLISVDGGDFQMATTTFSGMEGETVYVGKYKKSGGGGGGGNVNATFDNNCNFTYTGGRDDHVTKSYRVIRKDFSCSTGYTLSQSGNGKKLCEGTLRLISMDGGDFQMATTTFSGIEGETVYVGKYKKSGGGGGGGDVNATFDNNCNFTYSGGGDDHVTKSYRILQNNIDGGVCIKTESPNNQCVETTTCPSGYTKNGNQCEKITTQNVEQKCMIYQYSGEYDHDHGETYVYEDGYIQSAIPGMCYNIGILGFGSVKLCVQSGCKGGLSGGNYYWFASLNAEYVTSCPWPYIQNGTQCIKTETAPLIVNKCETTCSATNLDGYSLTQKNNQEELNPQRVVSITGGTQTRTNKYTCDNGAWKSGTEKILSVSCTAGYYSLNNTTCTGVGIGYYSPAGNNNRLVCTNGPKNSVYIGSGGGTNSCPWNCNSGYAEKTEWSYTPRIETCPSGYTKNGTQCQKSTPATNNTGCPSGYTRSGNSCTKQETTSLIETCPAKTQCIAEDYDENGDFVCLNYSITEKYYRLGGVLVDYDENGDSIYETRCIAPCPSGTDDVGSGCKTKTTTNTSTERICEYVLVDTFSNPQLRCRNVIRTSNSGGIINQYPYINSILSCPTDYIQSGTSCTKTTTTPLTSTYTCSSGILQGTNCVETREISYSCPDGYTMNGTQCRKQVKVIDYSSCKEEDKTPPSIEVSGVFEFKASDTPKINIKAEDEYSGIDTISYSWNNTCINNSSSQTITNDSNINYTKAGIHKLYVCAKDKSSNIKEINRDVIIHPGDLSQEKSSLKVDYNGNKYASDNNYYTYTISLKDKYDNPIVGKKLNSITHETSFATGLFDIKLENGESSLFADNFNSNSNQNGEVTFRLNSYAPGEFSQSFNIKMFSWNDKNIDLSSPIHSINLILAGNNKFLKPFVLDKIEVSTIDTASGGLCSIQTNWTGKPEIAKNLKYRLSILNTGNLISYSNGSIDINQNKFKNTIQGHRWNNFGDISSTFNNINNACLGFKGELSATQNILESPKIKNENLKISYTYKGKQISYILNEVELGGCDIPTLGIKIEGNLQGGGKQEGTGQEANFSDISVSNVRLDIRRNAFNLINNLSSDTILNGIRYVEGDVTISGEISGYETLIVKDGNVIINGNLNPSKKKFGIIVLKDNYNVNTDYNKGGNIYVGKDVEEINALIYTDGAFRSATSSGNPYSDSELSKRLVVNGSIYSKNTIGGATDLIVEGIGGDYILPGGLKTTDYNLASYYDLNYVRKVSFCEGDPNPYSFLVKYNPANVLNPPIGFTIQ